MQYHLDTIPVWEAMEADAACPLCWLAHRTEQEEIDRTLGAGVMEPDVRIRFNHTGVCREHQKMLYARQNRLGHALLMDSRALEVLDRLRTLQREASASAVSRPHLPRRRQRSTLADALRDISESCVVCETVDAHMARYEKTLIHLWKTDAAFLKAWEASQGVCLPHAADLLDLATSQLLPARSRAFAAQVLSRLTFGLAQDEKDMAYFTRKFDYRNEALPWGESKTALQRAVNRLRGRCLEDERP